MDKFVMKKSTEANIYKSIRFPVEINSYIVRLILFTGIAKPCTTD